MHEQMKRNSITGRLLVLSDDKKKAISEFLEAAIDYEQTLRAIGDNADLFIAVQSEKIKLEPVPVEKAKAVLHSVSNQFEERKKPMIDAIAIIKEKIEILENMVQELDLEKFSHRIEHINETIGKFKPHVVRFESLTAQIEEQRKIKVAEAKEAILRFHRKDYFENLH
jgi:hypothetical protein